MLATLTPTLSQVDLLSPREYEVARQMLSGRTLRHICEIMGISYDTGKSHVKSIYAKLGVSSRDEFVDAVEATLP